MALPRLLVADIQDLTSRPGVRQIAVMNFLLTVHHNNDRLAALHNLNLDAGLYGWNEETYRAIQDGINRATFAKVTERLL